LRHDCEPDFSRLRGVKTDYCTNLSSLALEGEMQASDLMLIAGKVALTFKFPTIAN
jgi:hypothetical protein